MDTSEETQKYMLEQGYTGLKEVMAGIKKIRESHIYYHGGVGPTIPDQLSDIGGGAHSLAYKSKADWEKGVLWFGEVLIKIVDGGGVISVLSEDGSQTINAMTPEGQLGNIIAGIK